MVAVLVREHVRLREGAASRAESRPELVEEAEIDVDVLVDRAVERADVCRSVAAAGARRAGEEDSLRRHVAPAGAGEGARPVRLDAVDVTDDPAVLASVGVRSRAALLAEHLAGGCLGDCRAVEVAQRPVDAGTAAGEDGEDEVEDDTDEAEAAPSHGQAAAGQSPHGASASDVFDLRWVETRVVPEANHSSRSCVRPGYLACPWPKPARQRSGRGVNPLVGRSEA